MFVRRRWLATAHLSVREGQEVSTFDCRVPVSRTMMALVSLSAAFLRFSEFLSTGHVDIQRLAAFTILKGRGIVSQSVK